MQKVSEEYEEYEPDLEGADMARALENWDAIQQILNPLYDNAANKQSPKVAWTAEALVKVHHHVYNLTADDPMITLGMRKRHQLGGFWLYKRLALTVSAKCLSMAQRLPPLTDEAQFSGNVHHQVRRIESVARTANRLFSYLNRFWIHEERSKFQRTGIFEVYTLHINSLEEDFFPAVRFKASVLGIKHILNGGNLNVLAISAVKRLGRRLALQSRRRNRPVYLTSERLARSAPIFDALESPFKGTMLDTMLQSQFWMATIGHWALVVDSTVPGIVGPQEPVVRYELIAGDGSIESSWTPVTESMEHRLIHTGYTRFSDKEIEDAASKVISRMRGTYHVFRNNCQGFCRQLFACIKTPQTTRDMGEISKDWGTLPRAVQQDVLIHRRAEFARMRMMEMVGPPGALLPTPPHSFPLDIEAAVECSLEVCICVVLVKVWQQVESRVYVFLIFTLALSRLLDQDSAGTSRRIWFILSGNEPNEVTLIESEGILNSIFDRVLTKEDFAGSADENGEASSQLSLARRPSMLEWALSTTSE